MSLLSCVNFFNLLHLFMVAVSEVKVVRSKNERIQIIRSMHDGVGQSDESIALAGHIGRDKCISKVMERYVLH